MTRASEERGRGLRGETPGSREKEDHIKRVLLAIRDVNQLIVQEDDPERLIREACETLTSTLGYFHAWIVLLDPDSRDVRLCAESGFRGQFEALRHRLLEGDFPECLRSALAGNGDTRVILDPGTDCVDCPIPEEYGPRAILIRRLRVRGRTHGVLTLSVPAERARDQEELSLFQELAGDLALGLQKIEDARALEEARRRYLELFQGSRDGFVFVDLHGRILDANQAFCHMLGYSLEELRAMEDFYRFTPEGWHAWEEEEIWDKRLMKEGYSGIYEKEYVRKDGSVFPVELQAYTVAGENGELRYVWGTVRDITEQKKVREHLTLRAEQYETLLSTALDGFWLVGEDGRLLDVNEAYCRMSGYAREELLGKHVSGLEAEEDPAAIQRHMDAVKVSGSDRFETKHRRKDGQVYDVEVSTSYWGRTDRFLSFIRDITERKRRKSELEDSEKRFRGLLQGLPLSVLVIKDGRYVLSNPEGARMLGYDSPEEVVGRDVLLSVPPDQQEVLKERLEAARRGRRNPPMELELSHPDGSTLWSLSTSVPMVFDQEPAVLVVGQDITERKRAQEAFKEARLRQEAAVRAGQVGLWDWDLRTDRVWYSREWKEQIGYADEEIGDDFQEWKSRVHPEDLEPTLARIQATLAGSDAGFETEFRFRHKDGSWRWILAHASVIRDQGGHPVRTLGSHVDITERKRVEEALRQSESRYRHLLGTIPYGVEEVDLEGRMVYLNDAYHRILGYEPGELEGSYIWDHDPTPEQARQVKDFFEHIKKEQPAPEPFVSQNVRKDGTLIDVHVDWDYNRDEGGDVQGFTAIVTDVTERKRAEEERERLLQAIEQAGEGILITDPQGTIQHVNPAFQEITGYTRDEAVGTGWKVWRAEELDQEMPADLREAMASGRPWHGRFPLQRKDGEERMQEATLSPVHDASGELVNYVAVIRDITEELRLAKEREELEGQFQQAQKMESIGRLAGGVAHDLNNLLSPILGYGEMLLEDLGAEDARRASAEAVLEAGEKARDLVRQLLTFSRKQVLEFKTLDLNKILGRFQGLLRRTIREDVAIELETDETLPLIQGDLGQLEQVVMNLAVNAQDAMPDGGRLVLETRKVELDEAPAIRGSHETTPPGVYALLRITDTGTGMDEHTRNHLFEPFFTTKAKGKGTGLGLATVYGIVKQHQGLTSVESEPGQGTTFEIYLPAARDQTLEEESPEAVSQDFRGSETILLVEDDGRVRRLARTILFRQGYRVLDAPDGETALALLEESREEPDLLLTDVVMPGMNGKVLADRVSEICPQVSILYMSGYTDEAIVDQRGLLRDVDFLHKPFSVSSLVTKVREVLDEEGPGEA